MERDAESCPGRPWPSAFRHHASTRPRPPVLPIRRTNSHAPSFPKSCLSCCARRYGGTLVAGYTAPSTESSPIKCGTPQELVEESATDTVSLDVADRDRLIRFRVSREALDDFVGQHP